MTARRVAVGGDGNHRGLRRARLGPDGPPDDRDQIDDRQLEDEHQEDDLDHADILEPELQTEDIRPVVVPGGVEALPLLV